MKKKLKQFNVTFFGVKRELIEKTISVEAESEESAQEMAESMLNWDSSIELEDIEVKKA